jgi:hypothetical protein
VAAVCEELRPESDPRFRWSCRRAVAGAVGTA